MRRTTALSGTATLALWVVAAVFPSASVAQPSLLAGVSGDRVFVGGAELIDSVDAQMDFWLDGAIETAEFSDSVERSELSDGEESLRLTWDTVFGAGEGLAFGGRFQFSYSQSSVQDRLGPDLAGILGKFQLGDPARPVPIALIVGAGKEFIDSDTMLEAAVAFGFQPHENWDVDLSPFVLFRMSTLSDTTLTGGFVVSPAWYPNDWFTLVLDTSGQTAIELETDDLSWQLDTALRAGFTVADGHEIIVGGRRTLIGGAAVEETGAFLAWRYRWTTEGGLLRLDYDGGPSPEPAEWEGAEP